MNHSDQVIGDARACRTAPLSSVNGGLSIRAEQISVPGGFELTFRHKKTLSDHRRRGPLNAASMTSVFLGISLLISLLVLVWARRVRSSRGSLPPGPPGLPVLGNILNMTNHEMWRRVFCWSKIYGELTPIICTKLFRILIHNIGDMIYIRL